MLQVSNPARPDTIPHLATVTALQPQSLLPGSPAACSTDALPCALLPPLLAFNLGLGYHLAPLLSCADSTALLHVQQTGLLSLQRCTIALKALSSKGSARNAASGSAAQHATSVCIASVRVPCEDLLLLSGSHPKGEEGERAHEAGHAGDPALGGAAARQEAQMEANDGGDEAAGDHLVEALQDYFAKMPRWVTFLRAMLSQQLCACAWCIVSHALDQRSRACTGCWRWGMCLRSAQPTAPARRPC